MLKSNAFDLLVNAELFSLYMLNVNDKTFSY